MRKILSLAMLMAAMFGGVLCAQTNDPVLMTVGNEKVTKSEFIKAYMKNSMLSEATEADLRDYVRLYSDYRMKVQEAKAMQLDTAKAFQKEWEAYKGQYAQQYLIDTEVSDQILQEAMDHSRYHVRASHILVRVPQDAAPKDTLAAYHKIMKIRDEIVGGLDFNEAAAKYSEDESARDMVNPQTGRFQYGNRGELGYFSVLEMIYPFEKAAYGTPVGQVSMPVRTQFGYHLIYVQDKIPAIAKLFVSQIFVRDTSALGKDADHHVALDRCALVKHLYQQGESFDSLAARYSDDQATRNSGGRMEPFAPNRRPGNYTAAAIALKKGQISDPVPSVIGWHILRLDSVVYTTVNDEFEYMIKNRVSRDSRSRKSKESLVEKLKVEYDYKEKGKAAAMKFFKKNMSENYFQSKHVAPDSIPGIEKLKPMCTYADQKLTAQDFGKYLSRFQGAQITGTVDNFLEQVFPNFVSENMLRYEGTQLMHKYPEYRDVVNEVYDGLLIYEVNAKKVWNAAIQDTVGTERLYEQIKEQFATGDTAQPYKPFSEVRAVVISQYQDQLEQEWLKELRQKYPVKLNEEVFQSILKR
ncbi:MAG: peptidylprolyl isomerase [Bacteroidales bacterium]|nr:peptidylprolyl isomerase [Bacteroidales bacterium]